MNPQCAKCSKTVYPTEKLNCLDKCWHKGCFRCEVCNMGLTMKNYKGYNKRPYCNAHYPTTKFTSVADTPENMRLKKQTANQSQLEYQKEHRDNLTKFTKVSDDPESLRLKKATAQASQVAYKSSVGGPPPPSNPQSQYQQPEPPMPSSYQPRNDPYMQQPPPQVQQAPPPQMAPQPPMPQPPPPQMGSKLVYIALYDYNAADDDEISFNEGDRIIEAEVIDEGWMTGKVERTGEAGMLPSNYVEPA